MRMMWNGGRAAALVSVVLSLAWAPALAQTANKVAKEAKASKPAAVAQAFAPDGPLASADPGYSPREVQNRMADAVARAIADRAALVSEAGTGVGKTFAYLVPVLLSGRRTLISTATKTLQEQGIEARLLKISYGRLRLNLLLSGASFAVGTRFIPSQCGQTRCRL